MAKAIRRYKGTWIRLTATDDKMLDTFKKIGRKVFVYTAPTLAVLVAKYGANAKLTAAQLKMTLIPATPEQTEQYDKWHVEYKARSAKHLRARVTSNLAYAQKALTRDKAAVSATERRIVKLEAELHALNLDTIADNTTA